MSTKKETRPVAGTTRRAEEPGQASRQDHVSMSNDTTDHPVGQAVKVSDFLHHGQQNAVPLKTLKELLHVDGRTVRLMIRAERLGGVPILADNQTGYYLPGDDAERARCVRSMRHRANEIVRAADAIEGAKDPLD